MPKKIGVYSLGEEIGQGPRGRVYEAYSDDPASPLAIKVFHSKSSAADPPADQLLQAWSKFASLEFRSLLPQIDYGMENGERYLVMPLMTGGSLEDRLVQAPLSITRVVEMLTPIAEALAYLHERGIVHGNVKPSNILFDDRGAAWLADLGLPAQAMSVDEMDALDLADPHYVSPEKIRGRTLDARADDYALGVLAYQALTGELPFQASTPKGVLFLQATGEPKPASELQPTLPQAIDHVLLKELAKEPEKRYPSALAFLSALAATDQVILEIALEPDRIEPPRTPQPVPAVRREALIPEQAVTQVKKRRVWGWVLGLGAICLFVFLNRIGGSRPSRPVVVIPRTPTPRAEIMATSTPSVDDLYLQGEQALNAGEYSKALSLFTATIMRDPEYKEAYLGRGIVYHYGLENLDLAILDFSRAIELDPEYIDAYLERGGAYYADARYESVIEDCEKVVSLRPEDPIALNLLAWTLAYDLDRDYEIALDYALQSVELSPSVYNHDTLAWVYFKLEQFELALEHFNIALSMNDKHPCSLRGRGYVYLGLGDREAALADFQAYLSLDHDEPEREQVEEIVAELQSP